jgi:hypothetical protein
VLVKQIPHSGVDLAVAALAGEGLVKEIRINMHQPVHGVPNQAGYGISVQAGHAVPSRHSMSRTGPQYHWSDPYVLAVILSALIGSILVSLVGVVSG